jgi:cytochrome o ubiquinol oxidase subunit 1
MAIAMLSFTVWVHHFFTMGQNANINAVFGIATMTIAVPTGVKLYDWIWTMFRGEVRFTTPMVYAIAFMMTFVIGGLTGIVLAMPPLDYLVHNTLFLVAHFHNMLIPGLLYGMLAGYTYWFPKAFGFRLNETWGRIACGCWIVGFYLAFMPLYVLGAGGMARRTQEIFEPAFRPWLYVAFAGALVLLCGLTSLVIQLWLSVRQRADNMVIAGDPWDGRSLEWWTSSPPPDYNFAVIPRVEDRDPFYAAKREGDAYRAPDRYEPIKIPRNSALGPVIGVAAAFAAFGLVWHMWWLMMVGVLAVIGAVIVRSFQRDVDRVISAEEVERTERAWLSKVHLANPVHRELEMTQANQGLAEVSA